ncbi:gliding motility associated protein GldN [compost metagenome]
MKKILLFTFFVSITLGVYAQNQGTIAAPPAGNAAKTKFAPKKDGYISTETTVADTVVPYSVINDEDKAYVKRVWREIDLRDRGNSVLASPKVNLLGVIYDALKSGELEMYAPDDESFKGQPVNNNRGRDLNAVGNTSADTLFLGVNPATNEINRANNEFFAASYTTIRLKEDWVLDIKRGIFEPRIIGIAPVRIDVRTPVDNNGNAVVDPVTNTVRADTLRMVAGWFYFDDLRKFLVHTKIANNGNDNSGINFDDVFVRRLFYSNITKWSNAADNRIEDYITDPKERLFESERFKKALSDFEQGLWEY